METWQILLIVLGVVVVLIMIVAGLYNGLVASREQYKNGYAQIDVQLKRRYDLIPNLVEAVKGYMTHERETLDAVIAARNVAWGASQKAAANPGDPDAMRKPRPGRGPAQRRPRPALGPRRSLSRPEGQPEHAVACKRN